MPAISAMPLVRAATRTFSEGHLRDRALVIRMLQHEETLATSAAGQDRYRNRLMDADRTLTVEKGFQRDVLAAFGFATDDGSVETYRRIFKTYFHTPDDYDAGVIGASYYMRNNRCVFYTAPELGVGDVAPNVPLVTLDGRDFRTRPTCSLTSSR